MQRANVRRTQASGKRRAREQANRTAGLPITSAPPTTQSSGASTAGFRRQFVWLLILVALGLIAVALARNSSNWLTALRALATPLGPGVSSNSIDTPRPITASVPATSPPRATIGIVSGHRGNDSGATCDDGLTEVSINFDTATRVAGLLRAEGYAVTILDEFDTQLNGYKADALLSIHSDSCKYINDQATGYKVARFLYSDIPQVEDKLVACISARYKKATGLRFHANTVTHNMLEYHALRKIDPKTPGAIIELGFMNLDRGVLTHRQNDMARGIVSGLQCFLREEKP